MAACWWGREPSGGWAYGWAAFGGGASGVWACGLLLLLLLLLLLGLCAGGGGAVGRKCGRHLTHRDHAQQRAAAACWCGRPLVAGLVGGPPLRAVHGRGRGLCTGVGVP